MLWIFETGMDRMNGMRIQVEGGARLPREVRLMQKALGLKGGAWADYAARAVRDGVVRNVQPFGTGKKAREKGVNAVRGDLLRCFRVVKDGKAGRRRVISSVGAAAEWHQRRRNGRGRVRRGERREITSSAFREYFEKVSGRVGMAKASLAGGADPRLKSRIAKWLRPWVKTGDATRKRKTGGAVWKFSGEPEAVADDRVMGMRGVKRVMRKQERLVMGALRRDFRRHLKKEERRVNR